MQYAIKRLFLYESETLLWDIKLWDNTLWVDTEWKHTMKCYYNV